MSLSMAEIEAVVRDLKPRLEGGRIERIDQQDRARLILTVRNGPARYWLLICADPRTSRLHLLTFRPERGSPSGGLCNIVREHLTSAVIETVRQVPNDRVVVIEATTWDRLMQPHRLRLVAELKGVGSNLLLLDESDQILGLLFREDSARRNLVPGARYEPLQPPATLPARARTNRFEQAVSEDDPLALSRAIQTCYTAIEAAGELESRRLDLLTVLTAGLKSRRTRLINILKDLRVAEDAEAIRRKGELLKLALHTVQPRQDRLVVEDLFDPARPQVTIELNPVLSPEGNIDWLFQQYRKAKAGRDRLAARASKTEKETAVLGELVAATQKARSFDELEGLKPSIRKAGLTLPEERPAKRRAAEAPRGPRVFRSAEGLDILVARNRKENDRLTFGIARGNDYWMHLLTWPGPHVVIRKPPDKSVSQESLLDAAHLAVYFSKIRGTDFAQVAYTQCKNVRRTKGAPPGKVHYAHATTLQVHIDPQRIERLMKGTPEEPESEQ